MIRDMISATMETASDDTRYDIGDYKNYDGKPPNDEYDA